MSKTETKNCQVCKQDFVVATEDFEFYKKIDVPAPTFCLTCRLQRRYAFRNERNLHKRSCDLCKKDTISMYSAGAPMPVFCPDCYRGDGWDPLDYGIDIDFKKPLLKQWKELQTRVPCQALFQENAVNSPWVNYELDDKNCYLCFGGHYNEDCAYNQYALKSKDSFDNFWLMQGEFCYETTLAENAHKNFFSTLCYDCQETYFSFDCRGCSSIFGCTGLRRKKYYIFNKPVSKKEFEKFIAENINGSHKKLQSIQQKAEKFIKSQPQRALFIDKSVNCTGNIIKESKNCKASWSIDKCEDSKNLMYALELKDSQDVTSAWKGELAYELIAAINQLANVKFTVGALNSTSTEYCFWMNNCHNCFGCFNMKNKKHCILNRQYTKEEYKRLVPKIKKNMEEMPYIDKKGRVYKYGEFFPIELSPFPYNDSLANEYFPLGEEEAKQSGYAWQGDDTPNYQFSDYEIPDNIIDVKDDILDQVLKCEVSGKAFKLIAMELQFYRRFNLPIPRVSPFERHRERVAFIKDHMELIKRKCFSCQKETETVYSEEEFPRIYCEKCYLKNVIA